MNMAQHVMSYADEENGYAVQEELQDDLDNHFPHSFNELLHILPVFQTSNNNPSGVNGKRPAHEYR